MALMVLAVYLVIANWENKRWLIVYAVIIVAFYASGAFNEVIHRFQHTSLTSGRVDAMKKYFADGIQPLHFLLGYGGNSTRIPHSYLYDIRAAFEFPPLMYALDYGIVFSFVMTGTYVVYATHRMLKNGKIISWMAIGLWYLQINTYYASSLNCHDAAWIMSIGVMIAVNCADQTERSSVLTQNTTDYEYSIARKSSVR